MFVISKYPFGTTYALMSDSDRKNHCQSRAAYIEKLIARIGREKPVFRDDYARLAKLILNKFSHWREPGYQSTLQSLQVGDGGYYGYGYGRFLHKKEWHSPLFEIQDYEMEPKPDEKLPYSLIKTKESVWFDFYLCDGCSIVKDSKKDPAKTEYGYDHYKFRLGDKSISMNCCKKCRAEIRRISRETLELSKNRTLINQLKREIQNGEN